MNDETEILLLKEKLKRFLEVHNKTKIPGSNDGSLKMHIAHARNHKKTHKKDLIINFLLSKLEERLLDAPSPIAPETLVECRFLVAELSDFYRNSL